MKLFVTQVAKDNQGTNMTIVSEFTDNPDGAIMAFHEQARALRGEASVLAYTVKILDEQLNQYGDYVETYIRLDEQEQVDALVNTSAGSKKENE